MGQDFLTKDQITNGSFLEKRGWKRYEMDDLFCSRHVLKIPKNYSFYLCPLWDYVNLADVTELCSVLGKKVKKGIDLIDFQESSDGYIAYGLFCKKVKPKAYRDLFDDLFEPSRNYE